MKLGTRFYLVNLNMKTRSIKAPKFSRPLPKEPLPFFFSNLNELPEKTLESSFRKELKKINPSLKGIMEKNPAKTKRSCRNSPETSPKGLPYRRRARSNSPIRESLKVLDRRNFAIFPQKGPVVARVNELVGLEVSEISEHFEEDEDLKTIKEQYCKLLEQATKFQLQPF